MPEAQPTSASEICLPSELYQALETAQRIANADFTGVVESGGKRLEQRDKTISPDKVDEQFPFLGSEPSAQQTKLLEYIEANLPLSLAKLPSEKIQPLLDQGLLVEKDGQLAFPDNLSPEGKIALLSALTNHIQETQRLFKTDPPIEASTFVTGLQALAIKLARQAYDQYQPSPVSKTETIEISQRKRAPVDRLKMSVAYTPLGEEGLELDLAREMIFSVRKNGEMVDNNDQKVTFQQISSPIAEIFPRLNQAAKNNDWEEVNNLAQQLITLAKKAREQFNLALEKNPAAKEQIIFRLRRIITIRLADSTIPDGKKMELHTLLSQDLASRENFKIALNLLFSYDEHLPNFQKQNKHEVRKAAGAFNRQFYEWGALIFGTEGLQRLVEVDLRMAVGLEDVLLTPEARLERIELLEKARELQAKKPDLSQETSEEAKQLKLFLAEQEYQQALTNLRHLEQKQRMAILHAFSVKFEDGRPVVDPSQITPEIRQLAEEIKQRYQTLIASAGQSKILEANRRMIQEMLQQKGVNLTQEQIEALNQALSEQGITLATEEILTKLGIEKGHPNYSLIKAILADGKRVNKAVVLLAKRAQDKYSKVENLSLLGDVFSMGLKGVEYLYRHGQFDEEKISKTVTIPSKPGEKPQIELPAEVPLYKLVETEAEIKVLTLQAEQPEEVVAPAKTAAVTEIPPAETPQQRLERLTTFDPKVVEWDKRKAEKLRQEIENRPREEEEGRKVSLRRLKEQLEAAKQERDSFDSSSIEELARQIYAPGIGQIPLREVDDQTRRLGETQVIYKTKDGRKIDLTTDEGLTGIAFEITKPSGKRGIIKLSREAILHSPELAKELMEEVLYQRKLEEQVSALQQAVSVKEELEAIKRAERNLAALEEKTKLRELVGGLKEKQNQQTAQRDLEQIKNIELPAGTLETAQKILEQLHRRGIFRSDINRFNRLADKIAQQLEQQQGWDSNAHEANIEAVKRALLYNAIVNSLPQQTAPPAATPEKPEEEPTTAESTTPATETPTTAEGEEAPTAAVEPQPQAEAVAPTGATQPEQVAVVPAPKESQA